MSAPGAFRPVNSHKPCVICGKGRWCRRTADGAHECHRVDQAAVNGYARIRKTPAGFTVYRHPEDPQSSRGCTSAANAERPRIFDSPEAAAKSFARWKKGTVERVYRWSDNWCRARIRLSDGKTFCEITRNSAGWVLRGPPKPHPLYRVGELPSEGIIGVCEGEKACDAGWSIDLPCTTSGAASSARSADWTNLRGYEVVIFPDHDAAGARYAEEVAGLLKSLDRAASAKVVELLGLNEGEDLYDFVNLHRDSRESDEIKAEIMALIASTPEYEVPNKPNTSAAHWPDPQPLSDVLPPVRAFDPSLLPESLRGWIEDIAERVQCPIDYPATGAMVALAAVVGRKLCIRPKRRDDWLVVPNLWGAIIGRPGVMKSPALAEVLKPIKRLEVEAREEYEREVRDYATAKMVDEIRSKECMKAIAKTVRDGGTRMRSRRS